MTYQEIHDAAAGQVGPYCKNCPVCNGKACGNTVPGPGCKYPGNTAARNYEKWQEVCVNMDTLCPNADPDVSFTMFGRKFSAPIFAAPLGSLDLHYGPKYKDPEYNRLLIKIAADCGVLAFTGEGVDPEIMKAAAEDMTRLGAPGIPTIKPWNKEFLFEKLDFLKERNIFAVAMDVDAAGLPFLKAMNPNAGSKSVEEMREIIDYAKMPFIIKGVMTVAGAEKAVEAGASGIVVSNHGGRVQGGVPSTAEVLPAIAKAVKGKLTILVDGGIRSGVDVFRALALGADGVLIGRPVVNMIYGGGEEGFRVLLDKIEGELKSTMSMCGAPTLADITADKVWQG
ncbi:MAG: alpha-hydroxy-acid oxidizing protein [Oscillospiraceae bacterium]|nr:alpha-hydroxy-acid oxidizing protein [Oscillospiraceae bacterium]